MSETPTKEPVAKSDGSEGPNGKTRRSQTPEKSSSSVRDSTIRTRDATDEERKPGASIEVGKATKPMLTKDEARARVDRVKRHAEELWLEYLALYEDGVHLSLGYTSWGSFFEAEFADWGKSRAYQLLSAGRVAVMLEAESTIVERPTNEGQARALLPLRDHPDRLAEAWELAVARAQAEEEFLLTAADVEKAVTEVIEAPRRALDKMLQEDVKSLNTEAKIRERIKKMGGPGNLTDADMKAVVDEEVAAAKSRDEGGGERINLGLKLRAAADKIREKPLAEFFADRRAAVGDDDQAREWLQGIRDNAAFILEQADAVLASFDSDTGVVPEADTSA
jgi:hypothetical protein